ncbi:MAG TPA: NADP-dependent phosphogluconate dehydrogenase [Chloroflexota bacterium]|nr:NADP-dependent phosphogluconate dehydrogenase [Chloroflexota bacterium]
MADGGAKIGVIGLAVMGQNLARNIARNGFPTAVYNRTAARTDELISQFGSEGNFTPAKELRQLVASIVRPRAIILMVQAGRAVDAVINDLKPLLEPGDIIIDGGNSYFPDTERRFKEVEAAGLRFIGTGISGGEEGALLGPSIMPGGSREAYEHVKPILTKIAAQVDGTPCCTYIGAGGAGHFVKMVHNGIEYADMQLIAESYDLLRLTLGLSAPELAEIFAEWNKGDLDSYLIEITADVLRKQDAASGKPLVDVILDEAAHKGTGKWTSQSALDLGVPVTAITEAVFARFLSSRKSERVKAAGVLPGPTAQRQSSGDRAALIEDVRRALYASKVIAYAQGFQQMAAAAEEYGWQLNMGEISTIWRGGCIIRARFLNRIKEAYDQVPDLENLLFAPYFRDAVAESQDAWRRVVTLAVQQGVPVPAFSSSLAYYDGYRRERLPANLLQGLRDYFGAHTYHRIDKPGTFHTRWAQEGNEVEVEASH